MEATSRPSQKHHVHTRLEASTAPPRLPARRRMLQARRSTRGLVRPRHCAPPHLALALPGRGVGLGPQLVRLPLGLPDPLCGRGEGG